MKDRIRNYEHIKLGDRVRLIHNSAFSRNKINDIGKVITIYTHGQFCKVDCGHDYTYNIDSYWGDLKKLSPTLHKQIRIL